MTLPALATAGGSVRFAPDRRHHAQVAAEQASERLDRLATLADVVRRHGLGPPGAASVLGRLSELDVADRALLANDPYFHASFTGLVHAIRGGRSAAVTRQLARLIPTLLLPTAGVGFGPVTLRVGSQGRLGLGAAGPRLRLDRQVEGRPIGLASDGSGTVSWKVDEGLSGLLHREARIGEGVPNVGPVDGPAFDGDDERLPAMLAEIGSDPESFAIETVTPARATPEMRRRLANCLRSLEQCWPELHDEISAAVSLIAPIRSQKSAAFTNTAWQGAIFLRDDFADPLFLIERIVHEAGHLRLNAALTRTRLHEHDWSERVGSPFRSGPRPVLGLVHGAFVFTRAAVALLRVSEGSDLAPRAASHAEALLDKVEVALATLRSSVRLTPAGKQLLDEIDQANTTAQATCAARVSEAVPMVLDSYYLRREM